MSDYPEHDKLAAVQAESQAIGEFLDGSGYVLCEMSRVDEWGDESRLLPVGRSIVQILADYFEIDLEKLETEKRAMLSAHRAVRA